MTTTTVVNDNRVDLGATAATNGGETRARRLAADLDRDDDRVDRVRSSVRNYATVWLADDFGSDEGAAFRPPEGYEIDGIFVASNGDIGAKVERSDA